MTFNSDGLGSDRSAAEARIRSFYEANSALNYCIDSIKKVDEDPNYSRKSGEDFDSNYFFSCNYFQTYQSRLTRIFSAFQRSQESNDPTIRTNFPAIKTAYELTQNRVAELSFPLGTGFLTDVEKLSKRAENQGFFAIRDDLRDPLTACFSNFHTCEIEFSEQHYPNADSVYQAQSTTPYWNARKEELMMNILRAKFGQNRNLLENLLATGSAFLVHVPTANHNVTVENTFGICLMKLRQEKGGTGVVDPDRPIEGFFPSIPASNIPSTPSLERNLPSLNVSSSTTSSTSAPVDLRRGSEAHKMYVENRPIQSSPTLSLSKDRPSATVDIRTGSYAHSMLLGNRPNQSSPTPILENKISSSTAAPTVTLIQQLSERASTQKFFPFYDDTTNPLTACFGNFHECKIEFGGSHYKNAESVFQAQKYTDQPQVLVQFKNATDNQAVSIAQSTPMTSMRLADWDNLGKKHVNKLDVMMNALRAKFGQNTSLKEMLMATGNAYLNYHLPSSDFSTDRFWSDGFDGTGNNKLGICLMQLRQECGGTGVVDKPQGLITLFQTLNRHSRSSSGTSPINISPGAISSQTRSIMNLGSSSK